jgi:hypothetical protein
MENSFGIPAGLTAPGRGNDPVLLSNLAALLHVSGADAAETAKKRGWRHQQELDGL